MDVDQLEISLKRVFKELKRANLFEGIHDHCLICQVNPEHCAEFKKYLQRLMCQHLIQFNRDPVEVEIDVVVPLINNRRLHISPTVPIQEEEPVMVVEPMVVYLPVRIPYKDTKVVPWNY